MTMVVNKNYQDVHTLGCFIKGVFNPVEDYDNYNDACEFADVLNNTGKVVIVSEWSPILYTVGTLQGDKFEPEYDTDILKNAYDYMLETK